MVDIAPNQPGEPPQHVRIAAVHQIFTKNLLPSIPQGEGGLLAFFPMRDPGHGLAWVSNANREGVRKILASIHDYLDEQDGVKTVLAEKPAHSWAEDTQAIERACPAQYALWATYTEVMKAQCRIQMARVLKAVETVP